MKLSFILLLLSGSFAFPQPSGTINAVSPVCINMPSPVTFTGSNGTAPYTFTYSIDGGTPQTITTVSGNSIDFNPLNFTPGTFNYTLISVEDATTATTTINSSIMVFVMPPPLISAGHYQTICEGNSITLTGSGGVTYYWDNGIQNGIPFQPAIGTMLITVTGVIAAGCLHTDQVIITTVSLPVDPGATIDSAYCNNGVISINQSAQTTGYSYLWNTGSTTSSIVGLSAGPYICYMYDPNGCSNQFTYVVPNTSQPTNCAQINGSVYFDNDEDCSFTSGDFPVANRIVMATPGNYLAVTDQNGNYSFQLPTGTYSVFEVFNSSTYGNYCNVNYDVTLTNSTDISNNNDFLDTINGIVDLQASIYNTAVLPGFNFVVQPYYSSVNLTGSLLNSDAWFTIPAGVTMLSWAYPHTVSNDTVYFTINTPQSFTSAIPFNATTSLPLGSVVTFCAGIAQHPMELITSNNTSCHSVIAIGSYDPNDKTTFVNGVQNDSTLLLSEQKLEYVIRFQNTGTAPAQNIYILDTIQPTLDLSSFEFVASSHPCSVSILEGNVLKFNFPSIMLPDSSSNEPQSHGFVHYTIKQSAQNQIGDILLNTAFIYFDFNAPVVTNTTYDELIEGDLGLTQLQYDQVKLYPNPSESFIIIESEQNIQSFEIIDLNGRMIASNQKVDSKKLSLDFSAYPKGIYLVNLTIGNQHIVRRISIQ